MSFYQTPQWKILFFVFLSMAVAVFYHQSKNQKNNLGSVSEVIEFGSLSPEKSNYEIEKCQCLQAGKESSPLLQIENIEKCPVNDLDVTGWPPLYRFERNKKPAEFPGLCLVPVLQRQLQDTGQKCLHLEYLNVVYNFFGDLSECFEIPQKEFLNTFSSTVRSPTLIQENWDYVKTQIYSSATTYCRQLQTVVSLADMDKNLQSLSVQAWHFKTVLEQVRNTASQTNLIGQIPEQWEAWVMARALDVGVAQAFSDIQNSAVSRKIASTTSQDKATDLIYKWSQTAYLQSLINTRQNFDEIFKEGACVPESFLRH